ncbi:MAG: acyl-CoA synthetase, partial [Ilumatobacteraceae bacterium]
AVFGIPHPYWVEAVTAVVVTKPGATVTTDELLDHARGRLAHFKAPKYVELVDALPKNPSGKILKRDLRDTFNDLARPVDQ